MFNSPSELRGKVDERIYDLQQQVRFCTCNYKYHHKNNDGIILKEHREALRQAEAELLDVLQHVERIEQLTSHATAKCDQMEAQLTDKYGCIVQKKLIADSGSDYHKNSNDDESEKEQQRQHSQNGYDSNKEK